MLSLRRFPLRRLPLRQNAAAGCLSWVVHFVLAQASLAQAVTDRFGRKLFSVSTRTTLRSDRR